MKHKILYHPSDLQSWLNVFCKAVVLSNCLFTNSDYDSNGAIYAELFKMQ